MSTKDDIETVVKSVGQQIIQNKAVQAAGTGVFVAGGAGTAGIAAVGVGNVVGGAGAVSAGTAIVSAGATAISTATTAAASIPVFGGAIAGGITTAAGAAVGVAAAAAAPIVLPALAIWGLWEWLKDD